MNSGGRSQGFPLVVDSWNSRNSSSTVDKTIWRTAVETVGQRVAWCSLHVCYVGRVFHSFARDSFIYIYPCSTSFQVISPFFVPAVHLLELWWRFDYRTSEIPKADLQLALWIDMRSLWDRIYALFIFPNLFFTFPKLQQTNHQAFRWLRGIMRRLVVLPIGAVKCCWCLFWFLAGVCLHPAPTAVVYDGFETRNVPTLAQLWKLAPDVCFRHVGCRSDDRHHSFGRRKDYPCSSGSPVIIQWLLQRNPSGSTT